MSHKRTKSLLALKGDLIKGPSLASLSSPPGRLDCLICEHIPILAGRLDSILWDILKPGILIRFVQGAMWLFDDGTGFRKNKATVRIYYLRYTAVVRELSFPYLGLILHSPNGSVPVIFLVQLQGE